MFFSKWKIPRGKYKKKKYFPKEIIPLQSLPVKELDEEVSAALTEQRNHEEPGRYAAFHFFLEQIQEYRCLKQTELPKNKF